jgi:hypothetical protein
MGNRLRNPALSAVSLLALALPLAASSASAQEEIATGEPSANRFYAAPGRGYLMVDGSDVTGETQPYFGVMFDYSHRPMTLDDFSNVTWAGPYDPTAPVRPPQRADELDVVGGMTTLQLTGAIALFNRLQIGLNVPIVLNTFGTGGDWRTCPSDGRGCTAGGRLIGGSGGTLGDPRLHLLVNLIDPDDSGGFGLGVAAWGTAPVARAITPGRYAGDPNFAVGGHMIFAVAAGGFRAAINVGGAYHEEVQVILSRRTPEMTWGAAAQYDFDQMWGLLVEATGATTFGLVYDNEAPTEIRASAVMRIDDFTIRLGGGAGLAYALGVPIFRVLGDFAYSPRPSTDSDGDGLLDNIDICPADVEDMDNYADEDGCPEPDNDDDQVLDAVDQCPEQPEDLDQHNDEDGCPDPDDDGDGVADGYDSCPNDPEDMDGDRDTDGCPDLDRDRDGVNDDVDRCPAEAEDTDGLADEDGCPDVDFDEDGVPDDGDECPEQAEDMDGFEDGNGCPEEGSATPTPRTRSRGR